MIVAAIEARPLRNLEHAAVELGGGVTSVIGDNGTGKTNLLEALHFALTGRSFRTGDRRELIPFGGQLARAEATLDGPEGRRCLLASVSRAEGRRHLLDGSPLDPIAAARLDSSPAVFAPDRMVLVKGAPAERRAHLDRFVTGRWPSRATLRQRYGQALAQRNALLAHVAAGIAREEELSPWDATMAEAAAALIEARAEAAGELAPPFAAAASELGIAGGATLDYAPRAEGDAEAIRRGLAERREADLRLGRSTWGPHLDELRICSGGRALRRYGSQGQQRLALLALLFAERQALLDSGAPAPLLLLDDVMSELDGERRALLAARLDRGGQALITATGESALPPAARQTVVEMPGARRRAHLAAA